MGGLGANESGEDAESGLLSSSDNSPSSKSAQSASGDAVRRGGYSREFLAGASYCCMSTAMVLMNKHALSSFHFTCPNSLLLFQCAMCCVLVKLTEAAGFVTVEKLSWRIVRLWLPVNILFVLMIWTSFYSLKFLNVAMVTVLKNLTNLITICGDYVFYKRSYSLGVWFSLSLMLTSALAGAYTDLTFSAEGYMWQMANCLTTASYSLYLRSVITQVQVLSSKTGGFEECSMVWYNNLLSLPFIAVLMLAFDEHKSLMSQQALHVWGFQLAAVGSGIIGFAISFCSLWFLSTTTPTTYSLVGSLNKIPLALIGLVSFNAKPSLQNTMSVGIGLLAGVVFGYVKSRPSKEAEASKPLGGSKIAGSVNTLVIKPDRSSKWFAR